MSWRVRNSGLTTKLTFTGWVEYTRSFRGRLELLTFRLVLARTQNYEFVNMNKSVKTYYKMNCERWREYHAYGGCNEES